MSGFVKFNQTDNYALLFFIGNQMLGRSIFEDHSS
uniref:Uncharacterized protein n=1 Tax=Rhizophora mucronata TaxID=61149 RepID=A0A2P2JF98_RHIMU